MTQFPHLLSSLKINQCEVRNRILVSAHVPGFAENNKPGEKYLAYHRRYAQSGVGLQITGGTPVHPSGLLGTSSDALWNLDDSIIPGYSKLSKTVHDEGGRILAQLAHSGGTVLINQPDRVSWSASAIRSRTSGNTSHAMSLAEIDEVITAFVDGAKRAAEGNMDGVEILAAFGFLPQAFLSPLTNFRQDEYGGTLENRMRFLLELLQAVRDGIGPDRILGLRIPGDEFEPGGLTIDDIKIVSVKLAESGLVDYLNVIAHTNISYTGRARHWAPTPAPHGLFIPLAEAIRSVVNLPVFTAGRITDPFHAERIIADGQADMVAMTRANICDPELVAKITSNRIKQIRPCVGANICIANRYNGKPITCIHNASVSKPESRTLPANNPKKISVIGAGPAGLEVARIAALRGHQVTVYERHSKPGGQLALWAAAPSMGELGNIIHWRISELDRLGVEIKLNQNIDRNHIASLDADAIVVATGAYDDAPLVPGEHTIQVLSTQSVLAGKQTTARRAIIINEGRGQAGLAAAELLLHRGVAVEIITSDIAVAADIDPTNRSAWYSRLGNLGCEFSANQIVESASQQQLSCRNIYDNRISYREQIDLIINWQGCRADQKLSGLIDRHISYIGDCVSPRNVEMAISEATLLASNL